MPLPGTQFIGSISFLGNSLIKPSLYFYFYGCKYKCNNSCTNDLNALPVKFRKRNFNNFVSYCEGTVVFQCSLIVSKTMFSLTKITPECSIAFIPQISPKALYIRRKLFSFVEIVELSYVNMTKICRVLDIIGFNDLTTGTN